MTIPSWVPQVRRPWNPAYRETWDAMTPNERRVSFLVDMVAILVLCGIAAIVFGVH